MIKEGTGVANKRTLENPLAGLELLGFRPQADEDVSARPRFADSKISVKAPAANRFATSMVGGKSHQQ